MRPGHWILVLSLIAMVAAVAGCTAGSQGSPTPSPASSVAASPAPGSIYSMQVQIADLKIAPGAGRTGNYTVTLQNIDGDEARNIEVCLDATDPKTMEPVQHSVVTLDSPISGYSNRTVLIPTGLYGVDVNSVMLHVRVTWGDYGEYWNDKNLSHVLPWAPEVTYYENHTS